MRRLTLGLAVVLALSLAAVAQDFPRAEINGRYSFMRVQTGSPNSFSSVNSSGFGGGFNFNFTRNVGIVADVSYAMVTKPTRSDDRVTSFLFGPEFKYRSETRFSPFGHFLVGAMHHGDNYVLGTPLVPTVVTPAESKWAYGFGGGVDARITDHFSARAVQVDYLRSHFLDYHQSYFRLSMGIVVKLGGGKAK
jgi:opacity protein-like surface antigen